MAPRRRLNSLSIRRAGRANYLGAPPIPACGVSGDDRLTEASRQGWATLPGSLLYPYTGNEIRDDPDIDYSLRGVRADGARATAAGQDGVCGSNRTAIEARKCDHRSRHRARRSAGGGYESLRLPSRRKARKGPFGDG